MKRTSTLAGDLLSRSEELAALLEEHSERVSFATYVSLCEIEVTLRELSQFIREPDPVAYLNRHLENADYEIALLRHLLKKSA